MIRFSVTGEVSLDRLEQPGQVTWHGLGGCATYLSLALARMGGQVMFATVAGRDFVDEWLLPLQQAGIELNLQRLPDTTARLELVYNPEGEIVDLSFCAGVEKQLHMDLLPDNFWARPWVLVGTSPHSFQQQVITRAKQAGQRTVLSTQGEFDDLWHLLAPMVPLLDVLFINSREVVNLRGGGLSAELAHLRHLNPALTLLVTCGRRGAFLIEGQTLWHVDANPAQVVNTTGAGDTFAATFLAAWTGGHPVDVALQQASLAASLTLGQMAHSGIPTRDQVQATGRQHAALVRSWPLGSAESNRRLDQEDQHCHHAIDKTVNR